MKLRRASAALVSGLLVMAFACATERVSQSQSEVTSGSAKQIRVPELPSPTGSFGVGRVGYEWTDESRPDGHAADSDAHRSLMVYLWYPASKVKGGGTSGEYLPGAKQMYTNAVVAPAMREEFKGAWPLIVSGAVSSLAIENAPIAQSHEKFPVVILAHGAGGTSFEYTSLIGDLVSHGYVVAAVENTYVAPAVAFPNGRIVPAYHEPLPPNLSQDERFKRMMKSAGEEMDTGARDIVFVLNQLTKLDNGDKGAFVLKKRLDLNRVASMGHSAGGANAALACELDSRFRACLSLDGQMPPFAAFPENSEGKWFTQPVLLLEVDHNGRWMGFNPAQNDAFLKKKENQLNRCPAGSYDVVLKSPALAHGSFSDYPLFAAVGDATETRRALHNLTLIESYIEAFLDQTLNRKPSSLLENTADHPEATVKQYGH
jgi:dienelactone hydrolase